MRCHNGDLDLHSTDITGLPKGLIASGSLDLSGTGVTGHVVSTLRNGDYIEGKYLYLHQNKALVYQTSSAPLKPLQHEEFRQLIPFTFKKA